MGMKLREKEERALTTKPSGVVVYDVFNEDGTKVCQCSSMDDVEMMINLHPNKKRYYVSVQLPAPPKVVNVSFTQGEKENSLNPQNILPETQQQPFTV